MLQGLATKCFKSGQINFLMNGLGLQWRGAMSWCPQMLERLGSKPSCLTSSPFYRFNLCQLKVVYCLKTQFKRVGGGGQGSGTEYS